MKKHLWKSLVIAGALLTSCSTFDEDFTVEVPDAIPVNIDGGIRQILTRATAEGFVDGDAVGIYVVNYTDENMTPGVLQDKGNQADHIQYTFIEAERRWQPSQVIYYKNEETNVDIYGYYPYFRPDNVSAYLFELQKDQSAPAEGSGLNGYEASDFLWGKAENIVPSTNKVRISYSHRMACANVVLQEGEGFVEGEFDLLDKNVIATNLTRRAEIDLATGTVTATGDVPAEGTVMLPCEDGFRAIVVPQVVEAYKPLFAITLGGVTYNFKKEEEFKFPAGQISRFTITVNKKSATGTYEFVLSDLDILEWKEDSETHMGEARQYYAVNLTEPGTLGRFLKNEKKDPAKIKNLKISGVIDARDFYFMRDTMTVLQAVNLKEAEIEAVDLSGSMDYSSIVRIQHFADEIPCRAFTVKKDLTYFAFPDSIVKIGDRAFSGCSLLSGALIIPDSVVEIGNYAFKECSNLTALSLPMELEKLGESAFDGCDNFVGNLMLPESLIYIGDSAFSDCVGFTGSLILPEALTFIGKQAFYGCRGFTGDLKIPHNVKELEYGTFWDCYGMRGQLILHDDLVFNDEYIFYGCSFTGELVLPKNLTKIPDLLFGNCLFSSIAEFPDGLLEIGNSAFGGCRRLSGILDFPETLVSLGEGAFSQCNLEGIILPANLGLIRRATFFECFYLNSIICRAIEPPTVIAGAFDGVPKDNFTVEVPEQAINRYQSDSQWGEFKRISAYRDFSVSRRMVRTLNAGCSRQFLVRALAEESWSIESKPDWVTVTPSFGTGKTEVTLTVEEMAKGSADRTGEVVFLLDGKDYRVKTKVEQYDYEYGDGDVITLQTATKGDGVNIVLMGDCYDAVDISDGNYLADLQEAYGYMFDIEPYKTYKDYFNVHLVFGLSDDSGMGTVNNIREAKFGSQYQHSGVDPDEQICFEYACKAPINDDVSRTLIILVPNTTEYGGITHVWGDGSAIAWCPKSADAYPYDFRGIVQHEAGGHGFGKLADEYIYTNGFIESCSCGNEHVSEFNEFKNLGWYKNLSLSGNMDEVDWSHLIFHPKYANMVDMYEGGFFHTRGVYRSEPNSCMNDNIPYFSAISRQAIVERIKEYAGEEFSLEEFYEKDVLTMTGVTGTKSFAPSFPVTYVSGRQSPPKYMGDKPNFNPNK